MKLFSLILLPLLMLNLCSCTMSTGKISAPVWLSTPGVEEVIVKDPFWTPKIDLNRETTIPYAFSKCAETGRIDNFAIAGGLMKGSFRGERYNDSDVFKIIEGACYSLMSNPDPKLRNYVDSLVTLISAAQEDDGYLYTTRTIDPVNVAPGAGRDRWIDERVSHELYNVGHMYEAAVAHYLATGSDAFLKVAVKNAELINREFGWGKREIAPGHQEIEIGLIKLYKVTGERKWLDLAKFFIDVRGKQAKYMRHPAGSRFEVYNDSVYLQMHKPVLEQTEAVGHAVRGAYMYSALVDLSEETLDNRYLDTSEKIWNDVTGRKIYITGGIGSLEYGEAFGAPYELPDMKAYTETCASVANVFWNHRLFNATADSKYIDVLERTLYNGLISGIGADGCSFFYSNPLESDGSFERAGWFECSCCPGNVSRFMPTLGQYIYSVSDSRIFVNLFIGSVANLKAGKDRITITQESGLPWKGNTLIRVDSVTTGNTIRMMIRIPAWLGSAPMPGGLYSYLDKSKSRVDISVNGQKADYKIENGFASINRSWNRGDEITVTFPLKPRFITAREEVKADNNRVAIGYGPLVYCLEEADNGKIREAVVDPSSTVDFKYDSSLLNGIGTLMFDVKIPGDKNIKAKAIPYYSWNNRGKGEMCVWMKAKN
jgi:uncharacterized protein